MKIRRLTESASQRISWKQLEDYKYKFSYSWIGGPNPTYADDLLRIANLNSCLCIYINPAYGNRFGKIFVCKREEDYNSVQKALEDSKLSNFIRLGKLQEFNVEGNIISILQKTSGLTADKFNALPATRKKQLAKHMADSINIDDYNSGYQKLSLGDYYMENSLSNERITENVQSSYKKGDRVYLISTNETGTVAKDFDWQNEDRVAVKIDGVGKMKYVLSTQLRDLRESKELITFGAKAKKLNEDAKDLPVPQGWTRSVENDEHKYEYSTDNVYCSVQVYNSFSDPKTLRILTSIMDLNNPENSKTIRTQKQVDNVDKDWDYTLLQAVYDADEIISTMRENHSKLSESSDYKVKFFQVFEAPKSPKENGKMIGQRGTLADANAFGKDKVGEGNYIIKAVCDDGKTRPIDNDTKASDFRMTRDDSHYKKGLDETYWIDNKEVMNEVDRLIKQLQDDGWMYRDDKYTGSNYYVIFQRRGESGAEFCGVVYSHTRKPEVIQLSYAQIVGDRPMDSFDGLRRRLGKALLPNGMNEDIREDAYTAQRYLDSELPDMLDHIISLIPNLREVEIRSIISASRKFYTLLEGIAARHSDVVKESLDESLFEDVEVETKGGPEQGPEFGLSSLLNEAIQDEFKTIDMYNSIAVTAKEEGFEDIVAVIDEINTEENKHVGQLQEILKTVSPNAEAIDAGEIEGSEQIGMPITESIGGIDDNSITLTDSVFYDLEQNLIDNGWTDILNFFKSKGWVNEGKVIIPEGTQLTKEDTGSYWTYYSINNSGMIIPFTQDSILELINNSNSSPNNINEGDADMTDRAKEIYNSFKDIEKELNGDGEAITAVIDKLYDDNREDSDYQSAYRHWADGE